MYLEYVYSYLTFVAFCPNTSRAIKVVHDDER